MKKVYIVREISCTSSTPQYLAESEYGGYCFKHIDFLGQVAKFTTKEEAEIVVSQFVNQKYVEIIETFE